MRSTLLMIPTTAADGSPLWWWQFATLVALVLVVLAAGLALGSQRWRALLAGQWPLLGLLLAALVFLPRVLPEGIPIRGYGVMLLLALVASLSLALVRARRVGLDPELLYSLLFVLVISGVLGARVFFVAQYWSREFAPLPIGEAMLRAVQFTTGGLVVYGAFLGASAAFVWFARKHRLPLLALADLVTPSLMLGLALGRVGCLLHGCCYGGQCDLPWAVRFPPDSPAYVDQLVHGQLHGVLVDERDGKLVLLAGGSREASGQEVLALDGQRATDLAAAAPRWANSLITGRPVTLMLASGEQLELAPVSAEASLPVHPTQLYEAGFALLLCWFLWSYYPARRHDGALLALLLVLYPIERFLVEVIRVDEASFAGTGLTVSQNLSLALCVLGLAMAAWLWRKPAIVAWGGPGPGPL